MYNVIYNKILAKYSSAIILFGGFRLAKSGGDDGAPAFVICDGYKFGGESGDRRATEGLRNIKTWY